MINIIVAVAVSAVFAQTCKPNALIDDFGSPKLDYLPGDPTPRYFNLMGGDYGAVGLTFDIQGPKKQVEIKTLNATDNFFFGKFDLGACFDLSGYSGIQFDLVAPVGVDMSFTLTQRSADCQSRLIDSTYTALSQYSKPDGTKKTVYIPLSDFAVNLNGGKFDFVHLKDWTIVNIKPAGSVIQISNLVLVGCGGNGGVVGSTSASAPKSAAVNPVSLAPAHVGIAAAPAASVTVPVGKTSDGQMPAKAGISILAFLATFF